MNDRKMLFSKITEYTALLIFVFLYQTCLAQKLVVFGVMPSALVASAVVVGMFGGAWGGFSYGLALGLICDATAGMLFGRYALLLMTVGLIAGFLVDLQLWRSLPAAIFMLLAAYGVQMLGNVVVQALIVGQTARIGYDTIRFLKEGLLSVLPLIPLYYAGRRIYKKFDSED